ncbi:T9SS type A sorting domain-containing protein [Carboxylicivirga sp. RSCT41]|uniref:T9SS type A sorting domain-containing protein n=1 Tax=Carboxylicivirga agarovorans TaxID=3417570 RepID=UPI003D351EDE
MAFGIIRIYNNVGVLVKSSEKLSTVKEINVSELSKGLYFVQLTSGNKLGTQKIIIR